MPRWKLYQKLSRKVRNVKKLPRRVRNVRLVYLGEYKETAGQFLSISNRAGQFLYIRSLRWAWPRCESGGPVCATLLWSPFGWFPFAMKTMKLNSFSLKPKNYSHD